MLSASVERSAESGWEHSVTRHTGKSYSSCRNEAPPFPAAKRRQVVDLLIRLQQVAEKIVPSIFLPIETSLVCKVGRRSGTVLLTGLRHKLVCHRCSYGSRVSRSIRPTRAFLSIHTFRHEPLPARRLLPSRGCRRHVSCLCKHRTCRFLLKQFSTYLTAASILSSGTSKPAFLADRKNVKCQPAIERSESWPLCRGSR